MPRKLVWSESVAGTFTAFRPDHGIFGELAHQKRDQNSILTAAYTEVTNVAHSLLERQRRGWNPKQRKAWGRGCWQAKAQATPIDLETDDWKMFRHCGKHTAAEAGKIEGYSCCLKAVFSVERNESLTHSLREEIDLKIFCQDSGDDLQFEMSWDRKYWWKADQRRQRIWPCACHPILSSQLGLRTITHQSLEKLLRKLHKSGLAFFWRSFGKLCCWCGSSVCVWHQATSWKNSAFCDGGRQ